MYILPPKYIFVLIVIYNLWIKISQTQYNNNRVGIKALTNPLLMLLVTT